MAEEQAKAGALFAKALRKEAEAGLPQAMLMLGKGAAPLEEALLWLDRAAEKGLGQAAGLAGLRCLEAGRKEEALERFHRGAVLNDGESLYRLGLMVWAGDGVAPNRLEALAYLQRAQEQGHAEAPKAVAQLESEGSGAPDGMAAMDLLKTIPKLHHPETMVALGRALMVGDQVGANPARAMELFYAASEQDWPEAHFELYRILTEGAVQYRDVKTAGRYLRRAADQGHPDAMLIVGLKIMKKRPDQAAPMLLRAAEHGHPDAMHALGELAYEGKGMVQNKLEALRWFRAAAQAGHRASAARAARMLRKGDGVLANRAEAEQWEQVAGPDGFWAKLGFRG